MNKSLKTIIWIVVVALVVWGIYSVSTQEKVSTEKPIKIAYISSLSGNAGVWGQSLKEGFDFGLEEINESGGIKGRKIEAIYENDGCDGTTGINAFNKAINIDKIRIITGTVCSSVAMSVAPITQENRVLYMASGATHPDVSKQGDLIFRVWVSDALEAEISAEYAANELKLSTFAIATINDNPAGPALKDNFKQIFEDNGGKILSVELFGSDQGDFRTFITKMMKDNPEGMYLAVVPEQMSVFINKTRELGYKGKLVLYSPSILSASTVEKILDKSDIFYPSPLIQKQTDFWKKFEEKTGKEADLLNAGGYDSIKLIEYGLEKCGEDNDCIRDEWLKLKDFEISRGNIGYDENGDIIGVKYEMKKLE